MKHDRIFIAPQRLILIIVSFPLLFSSISAQAQCYHPDGSPASDAIPCGPATGHSSCCGSLDLCLSDGYCFTHVNTMIGISRQSCTDQSWNDEACPYYCNDVRTEAGISVLLVIDQAKGSYCCGLGYNSTTNTCQYPTHNSYAPFTLDSTHIIYNRTSGSTQLPEALTVTATTTSGAESSTGKKAAVAVGATLGSLLGVTTLVLVGIVIFWRRAKASFRGLETKMQEAQYLHEKQLRTAKPTPHELHHNPVQEIGSDNDTPVSCVYEMGPSPMFDRNEDDS